MARYGRYLDAMSTGLARIGLGRTARRCVRTIETLAERVGLVPPWEAGLDRSYDETSADWARVSAGPGRHQERVGPPRAAPPDLCRSQPAEAAALRYGLPRARRHAAALPALAASGRASGRGGRTFERTTMSASCWSRSPRASSSSTSSTSTHRRACIKCSGASSSRCFGQTSKAAGCARDGSSPPPYGKQHGIEAIPESFADLVSPAHQSLFAATGAGTSRSRHPEMISLHVAGALHPLGPEPRFAGLLQIELDGLVATSERVDQQARGLRRLGLDHLADQGRPGVLARLPELLEPACMAHPATSSIMAILIQRRGRSPPRMRRASCRGRRR